MPSPMPSPDISRLLDHTRIRLPGALDAAIQIEFFALMKEFFIETNAWRTKIAFAALPGQEEYDITPSEGEIVRLGAVTDVNGRPMRATMPAIGRIALAMPPLAPETYDAHVTLTVAEPATVGDFPDFPQWVLDRYFQGILDGLLGRMMSQIAKPYSSPSIAALHLRNFKRTVASARVDSRKQNVYAAQPWRFPRGFAN